MEMMQFSFSRAPSIRFAPGSVSELPKIASRFGGRALLVTGGRSLEASGARGRIVKSLVEGGVFVDTISVSGEPSPELVDDAVKAHAGRGLEVVIAVGGGSVIDAGKAISAMLHLGEPVVEYLEAVGTKTHDGGKLPFIAIPTTAGTGSEATKNAVLSRTGPDGFKRSLRHDNLVPDFAIIDPELMVSCPREVTAASGLDALTQLIESFVSTGASPLTDALAFSGLEKVKESLLPACSSGSADVAHRGAMAYGALMSGIALANAGLGVVHGLASPLGSIFGIPHGVVCGTLLAAAVKATVRKIIDVDDAAGLRKYARVGSLFTDCDIREKGQCCVRLVDHLEELVDSLEMPPLSKYGVREEHFARIIAEGGNKNNPVPLDREETAALLRSRL